MVARSRRNSGFTLMELLISAILLAAVLLTCASIYITANQFLNAQERRWQQLDSFLAMEHMARRIPLGNEILLDPVNLWVKVRWDYGADYNVPNNTPALVGDDQWVKYGIIGNTLRWRVDATDVANVSATDAEVQPGLWVDPAGSSLAMTGPAGGPPTLDVRLRTRTSTGPDVFVTQHTGLLLRCRPEN